MPGRFRIEVVGARPWPAGLAGALPRSAAVAIQVVITPQPGARVAVAHRPVGVETIVHSGEPSAVEATILIVAGANAYVTRPSDLATAIRSVSAGEAWLAPVAAAAVCRLARLTRDPTPEAFAAAARAAAAGRAWRTACDVTGLAHSANLLSQVRMGL